MNFQQVIKDCPLIVTEGAVIERIYRESSFSLDSLLANAGFIYEPEKKRFLENIYRQYVNIVRPYDLPMFLLTPTWRANSERLNLAGLSHKNVNHDCFNFMSQIRDEYGDYSKRIYIGGLIGCKGDSYRPEQALPRDDSMEFHEDQVRTLADAGTDFLIASTLPSYSEALGIAEVMSNTKTPYIISFVIRSNGNLLDGTTMYEAIAGIDAATRLKPIAYMVNCVHPIIVEGALTQLRNTSNFVSKRVLGLQANTSKKSPEELDGLEELDTEEPEEFGRLMASLHKKFGIKVLGGCCGTDSRHIQAMLNKIFD